MNRFLISFMSTALAVTGFAQGYSLSFLPAPSNVNFTQITGVSKHGYYLLTVGDIQVQESWGPTMQNHALLYGPNYTLPPQDLNEGAGPYPTSGYWNGTFTAVNDKGRTFAYERQSPYTLASNEWVYDHVSHSLSALVPSPSNYIFADTSLTPVQAVLDDHSNVLTYEFAPDASGGYSFDSSPRIGEWISSQAALKILYPPTSGHPAVHVNDLGDDGVVCANFTSGGHVIGYTYRPGQPAQILTPPIDQYGDTSYPTCYAAAINDLDQVAINADQGTGGYVVDYNATVFVASIDPFTGLARNYRPLGTLESGIDFAQKIDNSGRVLGYEIVGYETIPVLWDTSGNPIYCMDLLPLSAPSGNYTFSTMDLNGVIYGTYLNTTTNVRTGFTLTP